MQRISTLLATLALGTAMIACSRDLDVATTSAPPSAPTATEPTATEPGTVDLEPLLLRAADLGTSWVPEADVDVADFTSLGDLPCPDTAINPTIAARLMPTVAAIFTNPDAEIIQGAQELLLTGDPARLDADLGILFEAATTCLGTDRVNDDGERVLYEAFDVPPVGDQRMAGRMTVTEPDGATTWYGWSVIVRVGPVAMMLNVFEIVASPDAARAISDADFLAVLQTAVDRVTDDG